VETATQLIVELPFATLAAAAKERKAALLIMTAATKAYFDFSKENYVAYRLSNCDGTEFVSWSENSVLVAGQKVLTEFLNVLLYQIEFTKRDGTKVVVVVDVSDVPGLPE